MRRLSVVALALSASCSGVAGPDAVVHDLDAARLRWLRARPRDYAFELQVRTAWFPPGGFDRIEVRDDVVTAVRHVDTGESRPSAHTPTIDGIYAQLVTARARGEPLSELRFDRDGVPLEAMYGTFANDGGVHFAVRGFTRLR